MSGKGIFTIPPSIFLENFNTHSVKRWIFKFISPGFGDAIDLILLFNSILSENEESKIYLFTNLHQIPFKLLSENIVVYPIQFCTLEAIKRLNGDVFIDLSVALDYPIYCANWLKYFVEAGFTIIHPTSDPFPLLSTDIKTIFHKRDLELKLPYVLHHTLNSRVEFEGRNTDLRNHRFIASYVAKAGFNVYEIGNDAPPTGLNPHLSELNFEELFCIIRNSVGFMGVDSFPMHVAALYAKPILGFFGSTHPYSVLPIFSPIVIFTNELLPCINCQAFNKPYKINKCLWNNQSCGNLLPQEYLESKTNSFLSHLKAGEGISDQFIQFIIKISKSEYELQKAIEATLNEIKPELISQLEKLRSPIQHMSMLKSADLLELQRIFEHR